MYMYVYMLYAWMSHRGEGAFTRGASSMGGGHPTDTGWPYSAAACSCGLNC